MRWIAWVNSWPFLLDPGMEPTEENVNQVRHKHGHKPLGEDDIINALTQAGPNFASQFGWTRNYYPPGYTLLDELVEAADG